MKINRWLVIVLALLVAFPALAKKDKPAKAPKSMREALEAAPLFPDPAVQERGQRLLDEACAAVLGGNTVCDLVVKDIDFAGFYFKPKDGVMLTTIAVMDTLEDDELRAGFAWAVGYAKWGLREKAAKMQAERVDALRGLRQVNPSVGAGSVHVQGNTAVSVGVGLGPDMVVAIVDGLALIVEDERLRKDYEDLDRKVAKKLRAAGFEDKGLVRLLKRARKAEDGNYLTDREIGIGRVTKDRVKQAQR